MSVWLLQVGFFATKTSVAAAYPATEGNPADWGVFYGGRGYQLGVQLLTIVAVAAWSLATSGIIFGTLRWCGWLRASEKDEDRGLDHSQSVGTGVNVLGQWLSSGLSMDWKCRRPGQVRTPIGSHYSFENFPSPND